VFRPIWVRANGVETGYSSGLMAWQPVVKQAVHLKSSEVRCRCEHIHAVACVLREWLAFCLTAAWVSRIRMCFTHVLNSTYVLRHNVGTRVDCCCAVQALGTHLD
jgi:hypothetical protein